MPAAVVPLKSAGLRDALSGRLQMLFGVGLVLFMWCHMLLLSSSIFGAGAFDAVAGFLEDTGLAQVGGPLILCLFLAHFLPAARKIPFTAGTPARPYPCREEGRCARILRIFGPRRGALGERGAVEAAGVGFP